MSPTSPSPFISSHAFRHRQRAPCACPPASASPRRAGTRHEARPHSCRLRLLHREHHARPGAVRPRAGERALECRRQVDLLPLERARHRLARAAAHRIAFARRAARSPSASPLRRPIPSRRYVADGPRSPDGRTRVVEANGDLYLVQLAGRPARRLTQTVARRSRIPTVLVTTARPSTSCATATPTRMSLADGCTSPAHRHPQRAGAEGLGEAPPASAAGSRRSSATSSRSCAIASLPTASRAPSARRVRRWDCSRSTSPPANACSPSMSRRTDAPRSSSSVSRATGQRQAEVPQFVTASGYVENLRGRTKVGDATGAPARALDLACRRARRRR